MRKTRTVLLSAVVLGVVGASSSARASGLPEFSGAVNVAELKAAAAAQAAPASTPAPARSNDEVVAGVAQGNAQLRDLVASLDLSVASPGAQGALRGVSVKLAEGTDGLQKSLASVRQLRDQFRKNGDMDQATNGIISALLGTAGSALAVMDLLPYKSELDGLKANKPYSDARAAGMALRAEIFNLQRGLNEIKKEIHALALEVNAVAAAKGAQGIDASTLQSLDYAANMKANRPDWDASDKERSALVAGAPAAFQSKAQRIAALSVYAWPDSR